MIEDTLSIIFLHQNPDYVTQCAELLNQQWPRSSSARIQSLEKSFKDLPDSLLLIEESNGIKSLIGHSRLTRVLEDNHGCWIGSVVISKMKRKKGYGKWLMNKSEEYARKLNFSTVYLNTQDQQGFYEYLGYVYCNPVSSICFKSQGLLLKSVFNSVKSAPIKSNLTDKQCDEPYYEKNEVLDNESKNIINTNVPPPPPPMPKPFPMPKLNSSLGQFWMKKQL